MNTKTSQHSSQSGFGLIELLVVILVMGILSAIAMPLFIGHRVRESNDIAYTDLTNALKVGKVVHDSSLNESSSTMNSSTFVATIMAHDNQFTWQTANINTSAAYQSTTIMSATNSPHWFTVCNRSKAPQKYFFCARQADNQDQGGGVLKINTPWSALGNNQLGEPRPNIDKSTGCTQADALQALSTTSATGTKTTKNAFGWVNNLPGNVQC